jgi:hypothetical protein
VDARVPGGRGGKIEADPLAATLGAVRTTALQLRGFAP